MSKNTVRITEELNLCTSCGACKGVCPKNCITLEKHRGIYAPVIDDSACVGCSLCAQACPGLRFSYPEHTNPEDAIRGEHMLTCNAWSKNAEVRFKAASGGVVTTLVERLLEVGLYDSVFQLDGYDYSTQLKTVRKVYADISNAESLNYCPKSRYLPVSHENAISYMKAHREERIILIGTSCGIRGILNAIRLLKLNRENYLLLGLFCDKVFNYPVFDYFVRQFGEGKQVSGIHFKNKESGGWPGDMKFLFSDGSFSYRSIRERAKVKEYFIPERCHYCVDKLNVCADISLGDNYTKVASSKDGSNSVIIRTEKGMQAWQTAEKLLEQVPVPYSDILEAQGTEWRLNNLHYARLFQFRNRKKLACAINDGVASEKDMFQFERSYNELLRKRQPSERYQESPEQFDALIQRGGTASNPLKRKMLRVYYTARRRILSALYKG